MLYLFRKFKFLYLMIIFNIFSNIAGNNYLDKHQAKNYIENLIDTLFIPTNHNGTYKRELEDFTYIITKRLLNRLGKYESFLSFSKIYDPNQIYQELILEILDFIEKNCINYATQELRLLLEKNNTIPNSIIIKEQEVIRKVTKRIRNEVYNIVKKSAYLESGVFTNYHGAPLISKIKDFLNSEIHNIINLQKPQILYPTKECPICYENFEDYDSYGNYIKRIYLRCGHNICSTCISKWYLEKLEKTTCPICRKNINILDFISEL